MRRLERGAIALWRHDREILPVLYLLLLRVCERGKTVDPQAVRRGRGNRAGCAVHLSRNIYERGPPPPPPPPTEFSLSSSRVVVVVDAAADKSRVIFPAEL